MGRLCVAQGKTHEAVARFKECGDRLASWGITNPGFVPWRSNAAQALANTGQRDAAIGLCEEEILAAQEYGVDRELGMALRAKGVLIGRKEGIELLRKAVEVLDRSQALLERARALTDLGAALRRSGRRVEARDTLRLGMDLASRCGATMLTERAHAELVAAGARPRRTWLSGVESLTASELRVCRMAASGLSNRQVAEALFVTEKTVEGHLVNAYRKLDVSSRSQLPGALGESGNEGESALANSVAG
jgi:DNA-binding CsgD family transcriptional regulator